MSHLPVTPHDFAAALDRLEAVTRRFASAADRVRDWTAPVPTCPGWTAHTLVVHLGLIHTWAASAIGAEHAPEDPPFEDDGAPLPEWYRGRAAGLLAALRDAGPEAQAWTLWGDRVAAFWARRQFHETAVHEFDLASALTAGAGDPVAWSIPGDLALDGLDEVLTGFYPRQVRLGRTPGLPAVVRFSVQTDDGEPVASLDAPAFGGGTEGPVLGIVAGTARELYLAVWGRGEFPGASPELVETIRGTKLTP
ncbi:maleylpyruvate isomerase family mycothiol-dependent enzyme [Sinomonas sp. JGH33]|uniref:Maleylpyruvate isomerase family mycothiol-dependent enzyme n=1 Tax=Sinomonas terricola TaxID=3110330 RepID=A0ABU5T3E2_9MICC|nr:maleylpyruvate isomerase family mycothiol-dependent enzyme [Sinomonas sp. JGH33]MEA5454019.1 maleylpyruvate isomerase family mycothiol-dependent enzyme [Sinomonas sp. JGH33]